jgi:hypothetical protein
MMHLIHHIKLFLLCCARVSTVVITVFTILAPVKLAFLLVLGGNHVRKVCLLVGIEHLGVLVTTAATRVFRTQTKGRQPYVW